MYLVNNFITKEEEFYILSNIKSTPHKKTNGRNSIQRFGSSLPKSNVVSSIIPDYFNFLLDRLLEQKLLKFKPDSVTINEYYKE